MLIIIPIILFGAAFGSVPDKLYEDRMSRLENRLQQQEKIIWRQDQRIKRLEKVVTTCTIKSEENVQLNTKLNEATEKLANLITLQESEIINIKELVVDLHAKEYENTRGLSFLKSILLKKNSESEKNDIVNEVNLGSAGIKKRSIERENRLLLPASTAATTATTVAFYAYMSTQEPSPSLHHTLVFDTVKENLGGGYNKFSGIFTVPFDGVYVFSYSVYVLCRTYVSVEIVKNADIEGAIIANTENSSCDDVASGLVVISAIHGDSIFVRTHSTLVSIGTGIVSNSFARPTFSGWLIH